MTHRTLSGLANAIPAEGTPRMTLGHVPSTMGQEWFCLLELMARPASYVDGHRQGIAPCPDTNRTDQSLLGGAVCPVLLACSLPGSMTVEANEVRLLSTLSAVHLLKDSLRLQTHHTLLGEGMNSPVPILHPNDGASKGQEVSHGE